jgi:hypothetical protein
MLVIEGKKTLGKQIAQQALKMAVERVTNDNTIRYVRFCLLTWFVCSVLGVMGLAFLPEYLKLYVVAGMSGATGAVLSVATRLEVFRLQPCNQSHELLDECDPGWHWRHRGISSFPFGANYIK